MSHKKTDPIYPQKTCWMANPFLQYYWPFPKYIKRFNFAISQVMEHFTRSSLAKNTSFPVWDHLKSAQAARSRGPQPRLRPSTRRSGGNSENAPGPGGQKRQKKVSSWGILRWNMVFWLVVEPTPLKSISQLGYYSQLIWKVIKFHGSSHHQPGFVWDRTLQLGSSSTWLYLEPVRFYVPIEISSSWISPKHVPSFSHHFRISQPSPPPHFSSSTRALDSQSHSWHLNAVTVDVGNRNSRRSILGTYIMNLYMYIYSLIYIYAQ